jgi:glycine/D-amino acid oxidase-like deaminating enzyme
MTFEEQERNDSIMSDAHVFHRDFVVKPYWWDDAPPEETRAPLPGRVDVAIVGSGYCGLAAGLELARAGLKVAVLDAGRIGEGASTRNGGMVSGGLKLPDALQKTLGAERSQRVTDAAVDSFHHLEAFLAREKLDASYVRCGRFVGAHSPGAHARQAAQAEAYTKTLGFNVKLVPKANQREEIGSDFYHGGLVVEDSGGLHPARYHRALRQAFAASGGTVHGFAGVESIERTGGRYTLKTSRGGIDAERVIVATNGYTGAATPHFQRRVIPVASFLIATEPLPADLIAELNPKGRMLADTKRILYYFRLSPDKTRVLFGGRASFRDIDERQSAQRLHQFMCNVWPQLRQTKITHAWKGNVAFTFDMLPHMSTHEGVHFAGGCQGNGVAMATYLGYQTAMQLLDAHRAPCVYAELPFTGRPLYSGNPWFLPFIGNYYRARDRIDRVFGC